MIKISLALAALRDPSFSPQLQLDALELAYCNAFSFLDDCELPAAADAELRTRLDALLALALGINVTEMPDDQFQIADTGGH